MGWTYMMIQAHEEKLSKSPKDRRGELIELWRQDRCQRSADCIVDMAIGLVGDGNVNERELGFYVLIDLCLVDVSLFPHLLELARYRSAKVRREFAFFIFSREFPREFCVELYWVLLCDKAASVRSRTIQLMGLASFQSALPELRALQKREKSPKVLEALDYWIPLLQDGYRVDFFSYAKNRLVITTLTGKGIASTTLEMTDPRDPRIQKTIANLRRTDERLS